MDLCFPSKQLWSGITSFPNPSALSLKAERYLLVSLLGVVSLWVFSYNALLSLENSKTLSKAWWGYCFRCCFCSLSQFILELLVHSKFIRVHLSIPPKTGSGGLSYPQSCLGLDLRSCEEMRTSHQGLAFFCRIKKMTYFPHHTPTHRVAFCAPAIVLVIKLFTHFTEGDLEKFMTVMFRWKFDLKNIVLIDLGLWSTVIVDIFCWKCYFSLIVPLPLQT